jgi:hypothetical protein
VIVRESEWDDASRARALALTEYEDGLCLCGCGLPRAIAHKRQHFTVDKFRCYAGQAIEGVRRLEKAKHEKDVDPGWDDGLHYYAVPADDPAKGDHDN